MTTIFRNYPNNSEYALTRAGVCCDRQSVSHYDQLPDMSGTWEPVYHKAEIDQHGDPRFWTMWRRPIVTVEVGAFNFDLKHNYTEEARKTAAAVNEHAQQWVRENTQFNTVEEYEASLTATPVVSVGLNSEEIPF